LAKLNPIRENRNSQREEIALLKKKRGPFDPQINFLKPHLRRGTFGKNGPIWVHEKKFGTLYLKGNLTSGTLYL